MSEPVPEVGPRPKKGRKLKVPDQDRVERKRRVNNNEEFVDSKGEIKKPKAFQAVTWCCDTKCHEKFSEEEQRQIFDDFHTLGSYGRRALFFAYNVRSVYAKGISRKSGVKSLLHVYTLNEQRVCFRFFYNTLQVHSSRGYLALDKFQKLDIRDLRGIFPHKKLSTDHEQFAIDFILSVPRFVSHYNVDRTNACYLGCEWDEIKLFRAYEEKWKEITEDLANNPAMAPTTFHNIFKRFNLKFHPRTSDHCKTCDTLVAKQKHGIDNSDLHKQHLEKAKHLRVAMNRDFERAKNDETFEAISVDFEKTLIYPKLETSIVYYLRKLNLHNFGIHSAKMGKAFFFPWLEVEAGKGPDEVGSCLKIFIENYVKPPIKHLIIVGDSCGGQNRAFKIGLILSKILESHPSLEVIIFRYLLSGHSYLPNDRDFANFQRIINKQERIELISEYVRLMRECHVNAEPIEIIPMDHTKIISSDPLKEKTCQRKYTTKKEDFKMMQVHEMRVDKKNPSMLYFKYDITKDEVPRIPFPKNEI